MANLVKIIANSIIENVGDLIQLKEKELKDDSFSLVFHYKSHTYVFLCSLHHLDTPWQIIFYRKEGDIHIEELFTIYFNHNDFKEINCYEIPPVFFKEINKNSKELAIRIRLDLLNIINSGKD